MKIINVIEEEKMNKTDGTKSLKHVPIWIRDSKIINN